MSYCRCKIDATFLLNLLHRLIFYALPLIPTKQQRKHNKSEEDERRPPPSMVPVPIAVASHVLVKKKLPVIVFGEYLDKHSRKGWQDDLEDHECAICLNSVERKQEIRELYNCAHVYHRECLEGWVEQGRQSCPMCRLSVLPPPSLLLNQDPWRFERMLYLFGEDYLF